jgi:hypothetical protein
LIVAVAWAEHHPVLAKGDRPPIAIGRDVPDGQYRHDVSRARAKIMHDSRQFDIRRCFQTLCHEAHIGSLQSVRWICLRPFGGNDLAAGKVALREFLVLLRREQDG